MCPMISVSRDSAGVLGQAPISTAALHKLHKSLTKSAENLSKKRRILPNTSMMGRTLAIPICKALPCFVIHRDTPHDQDKENKKFKGATA